MARQYVDLSTPEGRERWAKAWPHSRVRVHEPGPPKRNYIDLDEEDRQRKEREAKSAKWRNFKLDPDWWKAHV